MAEPTTAIPQGGDAPDLEIVDETNNGSVNSVGHEGAAALDDLLKQATGGEPELTDEEKAKAEADAKATEEAAKAASATSDEDKAKAEAEAKAKADEEAKAKAPEPENFEKIELPPHAKPKTAEAFSEVKTLAKERLKEERAKREAAEKRAADLEREAQELKKAAPKADEKTEQELKELREFRAKVDIEADPKFREFDEKATRNTEAIYAKLKSAGADDTLIEHIKKLGGPAEVDWDKVVDKLPSQVRRFIDAKLVDNEDLAANKARAIEDAKKNASEYLSKRQVEFSQSSEAIVKATRAAVEASLPNLGWFAVKDIPKDAKPEEKAALEAHNKFVKETQSEVDSMISEHTPEMNAVRIAAFAQLKYERMERAKLDAAHKAEVEKLTKERDEAKGLLARVKNSSTTRLRDSSAPSAGDKGNAPKVSLNIRTEDALDQHLKEALAEQAARE
jgi:hypothetical protein